LFEIRLRKHRKEKLKSAWNECFILKN
jgi:hypothetical protein